MNQALVAFYQFTIWKDFALFLEPYHDTCLSGIEIINLLWLAGRFTRVRMFKVCRVTFPMRTGFAASHSGGKLEPVLDKLYEQSFLDR